LRKFILFIALFLSTLSSADFFDKGKSSVGIVLGAGSSNSESYTIVGVSGDYFILDGLSIGAGYRGWFGIDPTLNQLTFTSNYYIPLTHKFRPYIGAFIRETFVSDEDDYESYGGRVGFSMSVSKNAYASFGWVAERFSNCDSDRYECTNSYPEVVFSLAF